MTKAKAGKGLGRWIVIANQSEARIYATDSVRSPWVELRRLENPDAQEHPRDLVSDRPGRAFESGGVGRHAMEPPVDVKEQQAIRFATEIAREIDAGRIDDRIERLVLVAAPEFLGHLRRSLSAPAAALVTEEVAKNLVRLDPDDLREHLPEFW